MHRRFLQATLVQSKAAEDCRTPRRWRAIRPIVKLRVQFWRSRLPMSRQEVHGRNDSGGVADFALLIGLTGKTAGHPRGNSCKDWSRPEHRRMGRSPLMLTAG